MGSLFPLGMGPWGALCPPPVRVSLKLGGHAIRGVTIVRASLPSQIAAMRVPDFASIAEVASGWWLVWLLLTATNAPLYIMPFFDVHAMSLPDCCKRVD